MMPNDLPPRKIVYQQTHRWLRAGIFEQIVRNLRVLLRLTEKRHPNPTAAILDSRTLQSTPEGDAHTSHDGAKRRKESNVQIAVDTLGYLLALHVTPANEHDLEQVTELAHHPQEATSQSVEHVDQGYTGERAAAAAEEHGIGLGSCQIAGSEEGCVLLPRRWFVERNVVWLERFRRLARDYERLLETLAGLHLLAFSMPLLLREKYAR